MHSTAHARMPNTAARVDARIWRVRAWRLPAPPKTCLDESSRHHPSRCARHLRCAVSRRRRLPHGGLDQMYDMSGGRLGRTRARRPPSWILSRRNWIACDCGGSPFAAQQVTPLRRAPAPRRHRPRPCRRRRRFTRCFDAARDCPPGRGAASRAGAAPPDNAPLARHQPHRRDARPSLRRAPPRSLGDCASPTQG